MRGQVLNAQAIGADTQYGQNAPVIRRQALVWVVQVDQPVEWSSCVDWLGISLLCSRWMSSQAGADCLHHVCGNLATATGERKGSQGWMGK